jgi:hypothetical protein
MNSQDESSRKVKPTRKKNRMAQKKSKRTIKVRDLEPKKDAKGGMVANSRNQNRYMFNQGTHQGTHQGTQSQG